MKQLAERAVFVSLVPLALALGAFVVRETTRTLLPIGAPVAHAKELVPPAMLMLAALAKSPDRTLRVDSDASLARVVEVLPDGGRQASARVTGTLHLLADGTIESLILESEPDPRSAPGGHVDFRFHAQHGASQPSAVPGVHVCELDLWESNGDSGYQLAARIEWVREPGGAVRMHCIARYPGSPFENAWPDRVLNITPPCRLGLDLLFVPAE